MDLYNITNGSDHSYVINIYNRVARSKNSTDSIAIVVVWQWIIYYSLE